MRILLCLLAISCSAHGVENKWKGITCASVVFDASGPMTVNEELMCAAVEKELRSVGLRCLSSREPNNGPVAVIGLSAQSELDDGVYHFVISIDATTQATTSGGGGGFMSIYSNRALGSAGLKAANDRMLLEHYSGWALRLANEWLKDNPRQ